MDSLQGNRDLTGNQLDNMKNASFPSPLLNYKEMGATLELGGKEKVRDREAVLLIFKPKSGSIVRQYFDAESYILLRTVAKVEAPQVGELEQTTDLADYRDVDGVKVPFEVSVTSAFQSYVVKLAKVEHNGQLEEALFSKPAAEK